MPRFRFNWLLLLCVICANAFPLHLLADDAPQISSEGFDQRLNYDPPFQNRLKTELIATNTTYINGSGGRALLKIVTIRQFSLAGGEPQMTAEAPECYYSFPRKEVNSAGPLQVRAENGKFFVQGVGFFLRQTNSSLIISNQVHSILQLQPPTNGAPAAPTLIDSHRFEFLMRGEGSNGLATYRQDVRVNDPRMKLRSELLTAELPHEGANNRVHHIVAETNVDIDFLNDNGEHTHATGQKAVYDFKVINGVTNELLELTGHPRIDLTNGWMTADVFVMNRTTGTLIGRDNFHLHYPTAREKPGETNAPVESEISSDYFDYDFTTRFANFQGQVHASDAGMKLACETLVAKLPQSQPGVTNNPSTFDHVIAETNVAIDFADEKNNQQIHASGQRAVYNYHVTNGITNQVLELSGNPSVEFAPIAQGRLNHPQPAGWMTADVITVDRAQGKIWGYGNHHSVLTKQAGEPSTMDTEIFSDRFDFAMDTGVSTYHGHVRAYDPEMNLSGNFLTIKLGTDQKGKTNRIERVVADGNVVIDFAGKPFAAADFTNLTAFTARFNPPRDPVAQYVSTQLSPATRPLLAAYHGHEKDPALQTALALDFNRMTQSGTLYQPDRFAGTYLSLDTTDLLRQQPLGIDLVELNRLLLLDAFRGEIARNEKADKVRATGEHAVYSSLISGNTTNEVLELSGPARLDEPGRWATAEDRIIDNRTTGVTRFYGSPVFHTKLAGLVAERAPSPDKPADKKKKKHP
jgi:lipopolysaccharide export system protein LptA